VATILSDKFRTIAIVLTIARRKREMAVETQGWKSTAVDQEAGNGVAQDEEWVTVG